VSDVSDSARQVDSAPDDTGDDTMIRITVRVTPPMLAAIDRLVEAGEYPTRSECVRTGIRREFRDAGVERGDRRPGRGGDTLIGDGGWDPAQGDPATEDGPDHDVPVEEQLTARQRELVGRDGGGE